MKQTLIRDKFEKFGIYNIYIYIQIFHFIYTSWQHCCSLQIQHRATAGHVTKFSSPGRLRHTKRKQNWKLQALIPIAILQFLRKVNLLVSKNKKFR